MKKLTKLEYETEIIIERIKKYMRDNNISTDELMKMIKEKLEENQK